MEQEVSSDVLIIGSGLAGINLAIELAQSTNFSIVLITKQKIDDTNTKHAQGGIAAVLSEHDSFEGHIQDTLTAGDGLCREDVVNYIVKKGPEAIRTLIERGVRFDQNQNHLIDLGREGGHHNRRVAHVKDSTGQAIQEAIVEKVKQHSNVQIFEHHVAIDLVNVNGRVAGAYVLDTTRCRVISFRARVTVLATGGAGKTFQYTSNPDTASGDGIAIAFRAGAVVANMEFMQFHPTLYYNPDFKNFLISEALRGEGAKLRSIEGRAIMAGVHPMGDLAPRDIVARTIDHTLKETGDDYVYLDISHLGEKFVKERFPGIYKTLLEHGVDISKSPIPVVPAAHYTVGGVRASVNGETSLPGLYAVGEVTYTGLHGANRLASNSLLEAVVTSTAAANKIRDELTNNKIPLYTFKQWEPGAAVDSDEAVIIANNWAELRRFMWNYVGIVRTTKRLLRAKERIELLKREVNEYYWQFNVTKEILELRNLVGVAELIVQCALARKESRGTHYILDFPEKNRDVRDTLIQKNLGVYYSEDIALTQKK